MGVGTYDKASDDRANAGGDWTHTLTNAFRDITTLGSYGRERVAQRVADQVKQAQDDANLLIQKKRQTDMQLDVNASQSAKALANAATTNAINPATQTPLVDGTQQKGLGSDKKDFLGI